MMNCSHNKQLEFNPKNKMHYNRIFCFQESGCCLKCTLNIKMTGYLNNTEQKP